MTDQRIPEELNRMLSAYEITPTERYFALQNEYGFAYDQAIENIAKPKTKPKKKKVKTLDRNYNIPTTPKPKIKTEILPLDDDSIFPGRQAIVIFDKGIDAKQEIYLYRIF